MTENTIEVAAEAEYDDMIKSGVKTTEFWGSSILAVAGNVLAFFITFGLLTQVQEGTILDSLESVLMTLGVLASALTIFWSSLQPIRDYIKGRTDLKMKSMDSIHAVLNSNYEED